MDPTRPRLPRFDPASIVRLRDNICTHAAYPYYNDVMAGDTLAGFAADVAAILKPLRVDPEVVAASCNVLFNYELTQQRLRDFAWRIAGNLGRLRAGRPLVSSRLPEAPEWVPFQVLSALRMTTSKGSHGCEFTLKAMAGCWCPRTLVKFWKREVVSFLAADQLGFTRPWKSMPYQHPYQLVGLRFFGLLDPARTRDGRPDFHDVAATPSLVNHNQRILSRRFRLPGCACPFGYDGDAFVPCHLCGVGYMGEDGGDGCMAACHPAAYTPGPCPECKQAEAPFDPTVSTKTCIACVTKARTKREST